MSRPFLPREVRRNNSITARFTDGEAAMLRSISRCDGTTVSNIVRQLCVLGMRVESFASSPCDICALIKDDEGTYEFNPNTLDEKCYQCLIRQMIENDAYEGNINLELSKQSSVV